MMGRRKSPEKIQAEMERARRLEEISRITKEAEEKSEQEKKQHIVLGCPRRPRKWATDIEPRNFDENGREQMTEPEWYIDEYGREVQLVTLTTDRSLLDRYYPVEARFHYFKDEHKPLVIPKEYIDSMKPYKCKQYHCNVKKRPLQPGEKERDARFNAFVKALREKEENKKSGKSIAAKPSFLWKN